MNPDKHSNEARAKVRCPVCGMPWEAWSEERIGPSGEKVVHSGPRHPEDTVCAQYRPMPVPTWCFLARLKIDNAAIARRELLGGPATTEFSDGDARHA